MRALQGRFSWVGALLAAIGILGSAAAQPLDTDAKHNLAEGLKAFNRGDYDEALRIWRPLAEQGYAEAQNYLGGAYEVGRAIPQDYAEAAKWYRLAAEQGYGRAQSRLGWFYANGLGVPVDFVQAYKWFDLATVAHYPGWDNRGSKEAAEIRDRIASVMTAMQIAEAQKLARAWKPK